MFNGRNLAESWNPVVLRPMSAQKTTYLSFYFTSRRKKTAISVLLFLTNEHKSWILLKLTYYYHYH